MTQARDVYANQATVVGTVLSMNIKTGDVKNPKPGKPAKWEMLEAELSSCGSRLKVSVWPTKKDPQKHRNIHGTIPAGTKVIARGALQEQISEQGRIFRQIGAFVFEPTSEHEAEKLVYYAAGHLGHPVKTSANGKEIIVAPMTIVNKFTNAGSEEQQREETIHIHPEPAVLETLYKKVSPGRIIQTRGYIVNQVNFDEFGVPEGYKSELTVAKLEVRDEQNAMWLVVSEGMPATVASAPPSPKTLEGKPQGELTFNDDDDVPF